MEDFDSPMPNPLAGYRARHSAPVPTLVTWAHEHLLAMLVSMEIAPGTRIGIDAVARKLGISQTPIREALSRLEAENLVIKVPNVGYHASARMTPSEVSDLFALRQLIEPYAAARAAESMTGETLRQLSALVEETDRIQAEIGLAYARFAKADAMLHNLIATASGNPLIADTIERLHMHLHIFRFLFNTNAPREAAQEHAGIIHALLARDPAAAEAAMRIHLDQSLARMERLGTHRRPDEPTAAGPARPNLGPDSARRHLGATA